MALYQTNRYIGVLTGLLFCINFAPTLESCQEEYQAYLVRSIDSGLLVDGTDTSKLQLQIFTSLPHQIWHFERASRAGLFYIFNVYSGLVLDIGDHNAEDDYYYVQQSALNVNSSSQEWYLNPNSTIVNSFINWYLDVHGTNYESGSPIVLYKETGFAQQRFTLQEKS